MSGIPPIVARTDIHEVRVWLQNERRYAEAKWRPAKVDEFTAEQYKDWVLQYLHRATILGVDQPNGRQALLKALRTLQAMCESNVRRYGPLMEAGVPSGVIQDRAVGAIHEWVPDPPGGVS